MWHPDLELLTGGGMSRHRRVWIWAGRGLALTLMVALAIYLYIVGLDKADKIGSAIGVIVALAALLTPHLAPKSHVESSAAVPAQSSRQKIANVVVSGDMTQTRNISGDLLNTQASSKPYPADTQNLVPTAPSLAVSTPNVDNDSEIESRTVAESAPSTAPTQEIDKAWVGGRLTQVDSINGNVTLE
jgi:hypothetical protein